MIFCFLIICIIILIIFIFYLLFKPRCDPIAKNEINNFIRQIARYANASLNDNNPLIAALHSNYSAAYLFSLSDIKSDSEIKESTNIDIKKLRNIVINIQDKSNLNMLKFCPVDVQNEYLARMAGEYI